jgi:hypothetical protein
MAPHYEFFQRPTVYVNSPLLLSSAHSRTHGREGFLRHFQDRQRYCEVAAAIPDVRKKFCGGCVGKLLLGKRKFDSISSAQGYKFSPHSRAALAVNTKIAAAASSREMFACRLSGSPFRAFVAPTVGCVH